MTIGQDLTTLIQRMTAAVEEAEHRAKSAREQFTKGDCSESWVTSTNAELVRWRKAERLLREARACL